MKRNLKKTVEDYKKRYYGRNDNKGAFYCSDFDGILEISKYGDRVSVCDAVFNSLMAGFMIGYRCREREERKK